MSIWLSLVASLAEICHCQLNILCDRYGGKPSAEALSSFGNSFGCEAKAAQVASV